jgi:hypothetical protein
MITCPACGTQNPDTGKFCISCGVDLTATATEEKLMTDSVVTASEEMPAAPTPPEVPPEYISTPSPEPAFTPPPPPLYTPPQQSYSTATTTPAPAGAKDRTIALVLEALPGIFGFLGIGWLYSGNTNVGLAWLLGVLVWDAIAVVAILLTLPFTFGLTLCCCTWPINLALMGVSTYLLNDYTKKNAGMFEA